MKKIPDNFMKEMRIRVSNIFYVSIVIFQMFSEHVWREGPLDLLVEMGALLLISLGTFGRLWTSLYISGNKTRSLITDGPYSVVRNPLYLFTFVAMVGIGLASERFSILVIIVLFFAVYYPMVILAEQKKLLKVHGEAYAGYMKQVPAFIPNIKNMKEPLLFEVNTKAYRKSFTRGLWFVWLYMIFGLIESLHELHWLPVLFRTW